MYNFDDNTAFVTEKYETLNRSKNGARKDCEIRPKKTEINPKRFDQKKTIGDRS